ncbi:hypothetical protein JCM3765_002189 [Sporobolomyces pararoseus]
MESPFDTPTVRPDNPIKDALNIDQPSPPPPSSPRPASSSRPSFPTPMRSYDKSTSRTGNRMSQTRQNSTFSPSKKANSIYSSAPSSSFSASAKSPRNQQKRLGNDSSSTRRGSNAETQSIMSFQNRQPQAHDFQGPTPEELVRFAALCRRQYYANDAEAARKVGDILAKLPPSSVSIYSRTMATVRSEYHRDKEIERRLHVETTLASTPPGSTIKQILGVCLEDGLGGGVAAMRSSKARQARHQTFKAFVDSFCVKQIPGTHPFFRSLFAALWLQSIEPGRGGAGARRVEWEVDLAVFTEAGGGDSWTREAVEALKGILGMTERVKEPTHTDTFRSSMRTESIISASNDDASSTVPTPLVTVSSASSDGVSQATEKKQPPAVPPHRNRAPSDPFSDSHDSSVPLALPPRQNSASSSPRIEITSPDLTSTTSSTPFLSSSNLPSPEPTSPVSPTLSDVDQEKPLLPSPPSPAPSPSVLQSVEPQSRIFTLPSYLTNPELRSLCRLFPEFISTPARTVSRFRSCSVSSTDRTKAQKDAGVNNSAKVGHGELRIGSGERDPGWRGTLWERFVAWFRALFSR